MVARPRAPVPRRPLSASDAVAGAGFSSVHRATFPGSRRPTGCRGVGHLDPLQPAPARRTAAAPPSGPTAGRRSARTAAPVTGLSSWAAWRNSWSTWGSSKRLQSCWSFDPGLPWPSEYHPAVPTGTGPTSGSPGPCRSHRRRPRPPGPAGPARERGPRRSRPPAAGRLEPVAASSIHGSPCSTAIRTVEGRAGGVHVAGPAALGSSPATGAASRWSRIGRARTPPPPSTAHRTSARPRPGGPR